MPNPNLPNPGSDENDPGADLPLWQIKLPGSPSPTGQSRRLPGGPPSPWQILGRYQPGRPGKGDWPSGIPPYDWPDFNLGPYLPPGTKLPPTAVWNSPSGAYDAITAMQDLVYGYPYSGISKNRDVAEAIKFITDRSPGSPLSHLMQGPASQIDRGPTIYTGGQVTPGTPGYSGSIIDFLRNSMFGRNPLFAGLGR